MFAAVFAVFALIRRRRFVGRRRRCRRAMLAAATFSPFARCAADDATFAVRQSPSPFAYYAYRYSTCSPPAAGFTRVFAATSRR